LPQKVPGNFSVSLSLGFRVHLRIWKHHQQEVADFFSQHFRKLFFSRNSLTKGVVGASTTSSPDFLPQIAGNFSVAE
jgi:hypothetical protein